MELIETLNLGGKRQLLLVVCDGRRVLVGAGGDSIQSMVEMKDAMVGNAGLSGCEMDAETRNPSQEMRCY